MSNNNEGRFTAELLALMESTGLSPSQWAEMLGVSPAAVSQWRSGETIPSPERFRAIIRVCSDVGERSRERLEAWWKLMPISLAALRPDRSQSSETLGDYYVAPLYEAFHRVYKRLPFREKERVLKIAGDVSNFPENPHLGVLWPGLERSVATEFRDILFGLSRASFEKQHSFLDAARADFFALVLERPDPLAARVSHAEAGPRTHSWPNALVEAMQSAAKIAAESSIGAYAAVLPAYTFAVCGDGESRASRLEAWSELLSVALEREHEQIRNAQYPEFTGLSQAVQAQVIGQTDSTLRAHLREEVLRAYNRALDVPASPALHLDRLYWRSVSRSRPSAADKELTEASPEAWKKIKNALTQSTTFSHIQPKCRMNASPYAECVWQVLLRILFQQATGNTLDLEPIPWRAVASALQKNDIEVAFHNRSLERENPSHADPLFKYHGYEVVIAQSHLSGVLANQDVEADVRGQLGIICADGEISENEIKTWLQREAVKALFRGASVYYPQGTDMERALDEFLKRFNLSLADIKCHDDAGGEGILAILDGKADVLFGGNNDVAYLRRHFRARVPLKLQVPDEDIPIFEQGFDVPTSSSGRSTNVYFFAKKGVRRAQLCQTLQDLWPWVHRLWDILTENYDNLDIEGRRLKAELDECGIAWRQNLQLHLLHELNSLLCGSEPGGGGSIIPTEQHSGFLEDFAAIQQILADHNKWGPQAQTLGFTNHSSVVTSRP